MAGVFMDRKAGFEMVHGLLDRVMQILGVPFLQSKESKGEYGYYIAQSDGQSRSQSRNSMTTTFLPLSYPDSYHSLLYAVLLLVNA